MSYRILIRQQARCAMQAFLRNERVQVTEKIMLLGKNPFDERLSVRRLPGSSCFRLRVGVFRIIFMTAHSIVRILSVQKMNLPVVASEVNHD